MRLKQLPILFFVTLLYTLFYSYAAIAEPIVVGNVEYVRGVVSAKATAGEGRLLGQKGAPIYKTDSIVTGNTSFAVLKFQDGTKVTVRPKSVFVISEYQFKRNGGNSTNKAFFRLLRGGVRTVTGEMNTNNNENITLQTPSSQVNMSERNTDIVMRSCDGDCDEGRADKNTVARLALAKGAVYVSNSTGKRAVKTGDKVKAQDTLITANNAFAILVFVDKTRVTLESSTEFKIDKFVYPKGRPKQGDVLFNLVTGGARTLTGLIGKANPQQFKLKTLVATMGVRGTGFDTYYDNQTYVNVWQGSVTATRNGTTQNIDLNQTLRIGRDGFQRLQRFPARIQNKFRQNLRPDRVNTQNTFMSVKQGNVRLTDAGTNKNTGKQQQSIRLSTGESAVSNRIRSTKMTTSPRIINNDPYTTVAPNQVQSSFQKQLNKGVNQGQGQRQGNNRDNNRGNDRGNRGEQGNRPNNQERSRDSRGANDFDRFNGFDNFDGSNNQRGMGGSRGSQGPRPMGRP